MHGKKEQRVLQGRRATGNIGSSGAKTGSWTHQSRGSRKDCGVHLRPNGVPQTRPSYLYGQVPTHG